MESGAALLMGVDAFTLLDLLGKAAAHKGLKLCEGASEACSKPIKAYELDDRLLAALAEQGIKRQARPDCHDTIFTLVDKNPQEKVPGWEPSNFWNFRWLGGDENKFDLCVSLSVGFGMDTENRGIVFVPQARGSYVSAAGQLPNFRMFKALVESDEDAPLAAKELAASDGSLMVTWTELGLGGIRKLRDLFAEFAGRNELITQLDRDDQVFDPIPNPRHQRPGDELFIAEPAQPRVIQAWQRQLSGYHDRLFA